MATDDAVVKRCPCCDRVWGRAEWTTLEYVGELADGHGGKIELRNCPCRSTLGVLSTELDRTARL
jgi:hypothetical protein